VTATLFFRLLKEEEKEESLGAAVRGVRSAAASTLTHRAEQESFRMIPGAPFAYWVSDAMRRKFKEFQPLATQAMAQHGLSSKADFRWLRLAWEIPEPSACLQWWVPFAKGGEFSPYYADIHLLLDCTDNFAALKMELVMKYPYLLPKDGSRQKLLEECTGQEITGATAWVLHPENYYFRPGLTWPRRTTSGISFRVLAAGCVFADKGPAIFADTEGQLAVLLGLCNSRAFEGFATLSLGAADVAARSYEVGIVQRLPVPPNEPEATAQISLLARSIHDAKRSLDTATEHSHAFVLPAILLRPGPGLAGRLAGWNRSVSAAADKIVAAQREIDELCYRLYGISAEDRATIETQLGTDVRGLPAPLTSAQATAGLVSWAVGVAMGRFDVRLATGDQPIPEPPDPFAALPAVSPGVLPDGRIPSDFPAAVAQDGILVDDEGHPDDLVGGVREVLHLLWQSEADAVEKEACSLLGVQSLRDYLGRMGKGGFWDDHFRRYSKSRRCAPIYWPLQSPRGLSRVWVYAHRLTKDTLPKLLGSRYLGGKLAQVKHAIEELRPGGQTKPGLTKREESRLADLDELLLDLGELAARLRAVMGRVSDRGDTVGYVPVLDDGVALSAAPLHDLIPWPKTRKHGGRAVSELEACWEELAEGDYDWAHVAMLCWPARVTEKCRSDRSLALAHGLDAELFPGLRAELLRQVEPAATEEVEGEDALDAKEEEED
jgi:hypothetical protein